MAAAALGSRLALRGTSAPAAAAAALAFAASPAAAAAAPLALRPEWAAAMAVAAAGALAKEAAPAAAVKGGWSGCDARARRCGDLPRASEPAPACIYRDG